MAEFGNSTKSLWHPKLTIFPIESQFKKQNSFLELRNNDISESLRKVITLEKNSETGELSLSSTKLNCACKFIKNYDNNTIETAKALANLPRFKETPKRDDTQYNSKILNVEKTNSLLLEQKQDEEKLKVKKNTKNSKEKIMEIIKNDEKEKEKDQLKEAHSKNKIKKNQKFIYKASLFPNLSNLHEENNRFLPDESFLKLTRPIFPDYPSRGSYPKYEDLLRFYLRKKEESYQNNRHYLNSYY